MGPPLGIRILWNNVEILKIRIFDQKFKFFVIFYQKYPFFCPKSEFLGHFWTKMTFFVWHFWWGVAQNLNECDRQQSKVHSRVIRTRKIRLLESTSSTTTLFSTAKTCLLVNNFSANHVMGSQIDPLLYIHGWLLINSTRGKVRNILTNCLVLTN